MQLRPHQVRALAAMQHNKFGQIVVPTGGGKTMIMIKDLAERFANAERPMTIAVVAPRILLATQLCEEFFEDDGINLSNVVPAHIHSGESVHFSTTKVNQIVAFDNMCDAMQAHRIFFTTYNSLRRLNDAGLTFDVAYYDEAHNATKKNFFEEVANCDAKRYYYFTATPKHTRSPYGNGMNNYMVFGNIIEQCPAPELINNGSILPPTVDAYEVDFERLKGAQACDSDRETLLGILDRLDDTTAHKILVAAPNSRIMFNLLTKTNIIDECKNRGFEVMHITSKYGAYVNTLKVNREQFFHQFDTWGKDPSKKFIIFHYSILSEGINVHGLTQTVFLRNLNVIEMAQTIGRVIRVNRDDAADMAAGNLTPGACQMYRKSTGFVTVPVFKNYGVNTIKRLQNLVDTVFVKGLPAIHVTDY